MTTEDTILSEKILTISRQVMKTSNIQVSIVKTRRIHSAFSLDSNIAFKS